MPFRRFKKRRKMLYKPITHVPSAMSNSPAANIAIVFVAGVAARLAGAAITVDVTDEDRDREIGIGRRVGNMVATLTVATATTSGILEYAWVKVEKADTTPALGTLLPTSAECLASGTQQAIRQEQPGQVIHYGSMPFTSETTATRRIVAKWGKYGMAKCRIGDHFIFYVFQRTGTASTVYNVEFLYKTSG